MKYSFLLLFLTTPALFADEQILTRRLHHLRVGDTPEWSDFPPQAEGPRLELRFDATPSAGETTLRLRQQDVRQTWKVLLNGKELGRLVADENDTILSIPVPPGRLHAGANVLAVEQVGKVPDDIRVGDIVLDRRPVQQVLSEASVDITVLDADRTGQSLPCRLTVVAASGALAAVGATSNAQLAVRPGVIYTGTGRARFGLPAGEYTIHAGRGFECGVDSVRISVRAGDVVHKTLTIRREVPVKGHVSSDTHVHTLTYSGHGDCTLDERMLTIAGEGLELPIATDHNRHIDYHAAALKLGVRKYFTPVVGNEVTTALGHFNVFPMPADGPVPDFKLKDWKALSHSIAARGARIVILNHARDRHSGFRPFGPERHLSITGEDLDGWTLPANAMEVVNSGAQQTDVMQLVRDWLGLLNRGRYLTPVGSSDSHDVSRYIVGQGRTYIRSDSIDSAKIDISKAVDNFLQGRVLVSCGLLAEITVNDRFGPGDLVQAADELQVAVTVRGPSWVQADKVELYANGRKVREAQIPATAQGAVKWQGVWRLPKFGHDVHLVAVAGGPGVRELYWPIARPYQPMSAVVTPRVLGVTGAVWIDGDGDGKRSSAYDYARRVVDGSWPRLPEIVQALAKYDEAVALQAAGLLQGRDRSVAGAELRDLAVKAGPAVERAFADFAEAWRASQIARGQKR